MSRSIVAIDPGPEVSAWVEYDLDARRVIDCSRAAEGCEPNDDILAAAEAGRWRHISALIIERVEFYHDRKYGKGWHSIVYSYGLLAGILRAQGVPAILQPFRLMSLHLTDHPKAPKGAFRAAVYDRFGGRSRAVGRKRAPGPCHGVKGHAWDALAHAITYAERTP